MMKTFITCILFSVCCCISYAQNYVPFPTTNAVWRGENASWIHWPTFELYVLEYNQAIVGDTLLNGIIYHKIEETAIYNTYDNSSPNFPVLLSSVYFPQTYAGAFREDSLKKIYYFPDSAISEHLLYDFSLTVGDSFQTIFTQGYYLHITSIDSFYDGFVFRKKYLLDQGSNDFLIEGIGSNKGFNDWLVGFIEYYSVLFCFIENNHVKYPDSASNCSLVSVKEIQRPQSLFILAPNPTTEILNLKSEQPVLFPVELFVMDMQGKLISQKIIHNNDDLSLNVKSYATGAYLLVVKNKESVLFHCIFSKE